MAVCVCALETVTFHIFSLQSSKPTVYDVLPILMGRKFFAFAFWFPHYIKETRELRRQQKEEEEAKQK